MNLGPIEDAKRNVVRSRAQFDSTLGALQLRLKPANLAGEAWDGVKEKSSDIAEGALETVKKRPAAVSLALGAVALFLARGPLTRAASRLISGEEEQDDDRIVTTVKADGQDYRVSAPLVDASA